MLRGLVIAPVLAASLIGAVTMNRLAPVSAQDATPAAECPSTTPDENKAMVAEYQKALFSGGDVSAYLAPDFVYHDPSGEDVAEPGNQDTESWADSRLEDFPDQTYSDDLVAADGDLVATYLSWTGTQQDDDEEMGVPETGKRADWVSAVFYRFECGKISDVWRITDDLGRLEDLGVITDEELQTAEPAATPAA